MKYEALYKKISRWRENLLRFFQQFRLIVPTPRPNPVNPKVGLLTFTPLEEVEGSGSLVFVIPALGEGGFSNTV